MKQKKKKKKKKEKEGKEIKPKHISTKKNQTK